MTNRQSLNDWLQVAGPAAVATVLFFSGYFAVVFAVPVQIVLARRGKRAGVMTGVLLALFIILGRVVQIARIGVMSRELLMFLALDTLLPVGVVTALILFTVLRPYATWSVRLLGVAGVAVLFSIPAMIEIISPDELAVLLSGDVGSMLQSMGLPDDTAWFADQISRVVRNTLGAAMVTTVAVNWWVGMNFANIRRSVRTPVALHKAHAEDWLIWPLIVGMGFIVMHWLGRGPGLLAILGWNVALSTAFVFGVQGIGIVQHILMRRGVSPSVLRWTFTAIAVALFIPGLNALVIGGLPMLGVSELWVNFRRRGIDEGNTES